MPSVESHAPGTPSWLDLASTDMEESKAFYGGLFGWEFLVAPEPEAGGYTMALLNGKAAAAIMPQPQERIDLGVPSVWSLYATVDDVDAVTSTVEAAGGSVMAPPFDVFTAGRMSVIVDPTGAALCLWEPRDNIGSEVVNEPGAFTWAELQTSDQAAAVDFYGAVLGMTAEVMDMGPMGTMTGLKVEGNDVASAMDIQMDGVPPHWGAYFGVADTDAAVARVAELGGSVLVAPMDIPPGRMAVLADNVGAVFSVITLAG
jgi:predicted enzyme related to lactoylglutathione lyase